jgi:hypothetical protein
VQHDERLLAKLEVIVEKTSRATQAVPFPYRSSGMLRMREELASLDAARRQDMAIAWVQALSGQGDMICEGIFFFCLVLLVSVRCFMLVW